MVPDLAEFVKLVKGSFEELQRAAGLGGDAADAPDGTGEVHEGDGHGDAGGSEKDEGDAAPTDGSGNGTARP